MTQGRDPNPLQQLRAVDDAAAARLASPETHTLLLKAIVADDAEAAGSRTAADRARPRPRRKLGGLPRRPLIFGTALTAIAAGLVVLLAGLFSGGGATDAPSARAEILHGITAALGHRPGTIVIQQIRLASTVRFTQDKKRPASTSVITTTTVTETSVKGDEQRVLSTTSFQGRGHQQVIAGNSLEFYDSSDDTIYTTTQQALQAATIRRMKRTAPKGSAVGIASVTFTGIGGDDAPGRISVFEQQLRQHLYRLDGQTTIDGHPALRLVPSHRAVVLMNPDTGAHQLLGTVYLAPKTYYPIKEVTNTSNLVPGISDSLVEDWSEYRVLPATTANQRLVSLTALHPHARVVHSADAYLQASDPAPKH